MKRWHLELSCTGKGNDQVGCGLENKIYESDIFVTTDYLIDESIAYFFTFSCPSCGTKTDIKDYVIPKDIRRAKIEEFIYKSVKRR